MYILPVKFVYDILFATFLGFDWSYQNLNSENKRVPDAVATLHVRRAPKQNHSCSAERLTWTLVAVAGPESLLLHLHAAR